MKNKKAWIGVIALVLVVCLMGWLWMGSREQRVPGDKNFTVMVVHSDGSKSTFTYDTDDDYLGQTLVASGLAEGTEGPYGLEIHTVDGETASWEKDHSYWALYIGTEYATSGADGVVLTDGGEYALVYTIG